MPRDWKSPQRAAELTIKQFAVHIYRAHSSELVTSIEILSPTNKREPGLSKYRIKRAGLTSSQVHLVEIDLLRGGIRHLDGVGQ